MLTVTDSKFVGLGDSRWWHYMMQYCLPIDDLEFKTDASCIIYDPLINSTLGNTGLEIIKDGSVMDLMPRDHTVLLSTVQEPICASGPYPWHENVDIPNMIQAACERRGLDPTRFAYASGDYRINDFNQSVIKTFFVPGWNHLYWQYEQLIKSANDISNRTCAYTFLSFNRYIKSHRYYFIVRLHQEDMLKGNLISCPELICDLTFYQWGEDIEWKMQDHVTAHDPHGLLDWPALHNTAKQLMDVLPLVLDVRDFINNNCYERDTLISSMPFYDSSFMSVITESSAHGPGCNISEAIFRPIIFQQPFLTIAQPGMLALLRSWGFDVFDDLFDNSYDLEPCQYKRIEMVLDNIKRYHTLMPGELQDITQSIKHRLLANRDRYFSREFKNITREYLLEVYNWLHEKQ